ncbi:MAG: sodium-translocating pyrophosphatase [Thaumarchaeota archaeon]|jgi:K(+)-stimulated pyrophosphate-energized sodium pump|nr:sodium-translocating pyrophosphatase [Candidatus Terraquivivens yellowstonensis]
MFWLLPVSASIVALCAALAFTAWVLKQNPGNEVMRNISSAVKTGALAFIRREYVTILPIAIILAIVIGLASGYTNAIAFAVGAALSAVSGIIAILATVSAAPRAAQATEKGLGSTLSVAYRGGAVAGLTITAAALIAVTALYAIYPSPIAIAGVGVGASLIALFIRIGGGIYTKAADLGADLVGKVEAGIPEDDPRNPAVIADNVGDNIGDAAGMGSDVYESYIVTMLAAMLLGSLIGNVEFVIFPLMIGAAGLLASLIGTLTVTSRKVTSPMRPLTLSFAVAALITVVLNFFISTYMFGWNEMSYAFFVSTLLGAIIVPIIQKITDYYTSYSYKPVQEVAESTKVGHSANILTGVAVGLRSTFPMAIVIVVFIIVSYFLVSTVTGEPLMGIYSTAIMTATMLSLSGIVLSIDSFGPISDNAGGIVEMSGLGEENRKITDQLDAVGNTTKATTKGFAIASAALAAIALIQAFQHEVWTLASIPGNLLSGKTFVYTLTNPALIVGLLIGALLPFYVSSYLLRSVSVVASSIVEEVRRQFREIKGILEGKAKPDYARCIDIATRQSLRQLFTPALIVIVAPIVVGIILGPVAVAGLLTGAVASGLYLAYYMANSGAAWDNAKKYLEALGLKKTPQHAVAVAGDLVGDPYKDTAGPALNTVIKLLNTVSIVFVPIFIGLIAL